MRYSKWTVRHWALGLVFWAPLLGACSAQEEASDALKVGSFAGPVQDGECGTLTQSNDSYKGLSLGLSMVDGKATSIPGEVRLDCKKDVVIFVHGWSTGGTPSEFAHADLWQERGFQTFVFRWHDLSTSRNFDVQFVEYTKTAAGRLSEAIRELYASLGGSRYQGEIRVVGHSLGGKVAAESVSNLAPIKGSSTLGTSSVQYHADVPISRLTLLDPAVFANWNENEVSLCPMLRLSTGPGSDIFEGSVTDPLTDEATRFRAILSLIPDSVAVEVYGANVASAFSFSLADRYLVQTVTTAGPFGCYINFEGLNMFEIHNSVIDGYFESIAHEAPLATQSDGSKKRLNSASVATKDLVRTPGWYILKEGHPLAKWNEHVFVKQTIPKDYFRITIDKGCVNPFDVDEDCQAGLEYVIRF